MGCQNKVAYDDGKDFYSLYANSGLMLGQWVQQPSAYPPPSST